MFSFFNLVKIFLKINIRCFLFSQQRECSRWMNKLDYQPTKTADNSIIVIESHETVSRSHKNTAFCGSLMWHSDLEKMHVLLSIANYYNWNKKKFDHSGGSRIISMFWTLIWVSHDCDFCPKLVTVGLRHWKKNWNCLQKEICNQIVHHNKYRNNLSSLRHQI